MCHSFSSTGEWTGLRWHSRYKIIKGICDGLKHLHGERIFHLDLKPANILLDKDMVPKIADFGLSRLFSEEKTWTLTTSRDGTLYVKCLLTVHSFRGR